MYTHHAQVLSNDIGAAPDVAALVGFSQRLPAVLVQMVQNGVASGDAVYTLSQCGQAITQRLLVLAEARFGSPPIPYAFIVAGSMGRNEQSAHSDQDNAMILADTFQPERHDAYFLQVAQFVSDGLAACGYVYCPGNIMATNPQWRQPLHVWQAQFRHWIETPEPLALLNATIFFDLRGIYGEASLWHDLRDDLLARTHSHELFQILLAENARSFHPPLRFWGGFSSQRNTNGEKVIDLKKGGVVPVIDMARVYALAQGLPEVNTAARLLALASHGVMNAGDAHDLIEALDCIGGLRLQHQVRQIQQGIVPDNLLLLADLSSEERHHLKAMFKVVAGLQEAMFRHYCVN